MEFEIPWRRIATGAAVLFLHLLVVIGLLLATRLPVTQQVRQVREMVLTLLAPHRTNKAEQRDYNLPALQFVQPERTPQAITLPPPPAPTKSPEDQGDLIGLGRYLYNCSGAYYEQLSPHDKAGCLSNKWESKPSQQQPLLGEQKPSPFDVVISKRHEPAQGIEHACAPDAPNANLGMPCFSFPGH